MCAGSSVMRRHALAKSLTPRLAPFIRPWARVTTRLMQAVETIGFATSGMLGTRLGERLGIQTSWMTVLRRMMALPTVPVGRVSQLGMDDFSFRRGRRFGTILVNLQSHQTVDLLPVRNVETAAAWMAAHPEIDLVSRDRGGDYASAARAGCSPGGPVCGSVPFDQKSGRGSAGDTGTSSGHSSAGADRSRLVHPVGNSATETASASASKERCAQFGQTRPTPGSIPAGHSPA